MNKFIIYTILLLCLVAAVGVLGVLFMHQGFFRASVLDIIGFLTTLNLMDYMV